MERCLFCQIIQGEVPSNPVYEDEDVFAFKDINPQAPVHVLVIPKRHVMSVSEVQDPNLIGTVMMRAAKIARQEGLEDNGYRLVTNHGYDGGQTVFHLHVHLLGGRTLDWPPG